MRCCVIRPLRAQVVIENGKCTSRTESVRLQYACLCKVHTCRGKHGGESSAKMSAVNGVVKTNKIQTSGKNIESQV